MLSTQREQVEALLYNRRKTCMEELLGYAINSEERAFFRDWFSKDFVPIENLHITQWIELYKQFTGSKDPSKDETMD